MGIFFGGQMNMDMTTVVIIVISVVFFFLGRFLNLRILNAKIVNDKKSAEKTLSDAKIEAERLKKAKILEGKDRVYRLKRDFEREIRQKRNEINRLSKQVAEREENMDRRADLLVKRENELNKQKNQLSQNQMELNKKTEELDRLVREKIKQLESISRLTQDEAKKQLFTNLEEEVKREAAVTMKNIREKARLNANKEAKEMVIQAIQKISCSQAVESTTSLVRLPSDDMKGRIIGREGRNIRSFEMATGVEVIVDDTPEVVLLSCFEPIRREIAKLSLLKLIGDGRIHPGRIEDVVEKAREELEEKIADEGEHAILDVGIHGFSLEMTKAIGKLNYLTTFGQNMLQHSIEVAQLAGNIAAELGLDVNLTKRAGLLHDIGKALERRSEQTFAQMGADFTKKHGEGPVVQNTIQSFDGETQATSAIAVLVHAADQISSNRPGAQRENLALYIKRLEKLENAVREFNGIRETFVIQAGKEIKVVVDPEQLDDVQSNQLGIDIAKKIKNELKFPGQIKVSVIREFRAVNIAK